MANKINTYTGKINEFVDWVTGNDSNTELNVTNNLPVSGGSIRALIQDRLKVPFCMYEDKENNLYRMFSSTASLNLWLSDNVTYKKLELFNFVRPSEYEISTDINLNPRYLISNDDSQTASILSYNWVVKNSTGTFLDSITAIYTITDKDGNTLSFSELYSTTHTAVSLNLYKYLKAGNNTISVVLKGNSTGAILGVTFIMVVLTLQVDSSFDFNAKHTLGNNLDIPYTLTRNNTSIPTTIYFYIDGVKVNKVDIAANSASAFIKNDISVVNSYVDQTKHNLLIWAEMEYDNSTFRSNIMYFTFETASDSTITNYFLNTKRSFYGGIPPISEFTITGTQYMPISLEWGYYTDNLQTDTSINVTWTIKQGDTATVINNITVDRYQQASDLVFSPIIYSTDDQPITLVATYGTKELIVIPMTIAKSSLVMYEAPNYVLKLSAYGKTNTSVDKSIWKDTVNNIDTTFTNINYDNNIGWNDNALRVSGIDSYATINYSPLNGNPSLGRTIEFEFESEKVSSDNDVIIRIGDTSGGHIDVTPNTAAIYDASGISILHTNFKSNERVKLAFIINETNSTVDSNLIYIVNNGILERAAGGSGYIFANNTGKITIGKSNSGVKFYGIRVYNRAISYTDAYNNFVFDSDDKGDIISRNNVITNGAIDYNLCVNKIDTILISGDLSNILNSAFDKDQSSTDVTLERFCPFDSTKNFKIEGGLIRKHGQSTLNYPISAMKFWSSKSTTGATPVFTCTDQIPLLLTKNRYKMKDDSIPSNKWVLQANYADSSGVHNGTMEKLFNSTWFNAVIDGEYKLRTEPQLFSTNLITTNNDSNLHGDGYIAGKNADGKQWKDYFSTDFPYQLEIAPDSFPCVVFYLDTSGSNTKTFLGQFVFMEDKESDYCYGERSIYKASAKDVFCLTSTFKGMDTDANRIWDNTNVSRFEVLDVNSLYTSYMSNTGFTDIIKDSITGQPTQYAFEQKFEMIYPSPSNLAGNPTNGTDKFGVNSKFLRKAQPFINWFTWLTGTYLNQTKFENEAASHIDLYKIAAYYIKMLRYGLVDSCERNAQITTYDGVHFFYRPWDMDIALGNQNTGGIAFNPPIDRNTTLSTDNSVYAFSGKSPTTSNWLFDALEAWPYWRDVIVPKVAQALYIANLSYDHSIDLFDGEYAEKWCEIIYNESGHFKYVYSRAGANSWLNWLQGARTTHRHWWLSTSMDYYDAKWSCGDFRNHYIYFALNHDAGTTAGVDIITVKPNAPTYLKLSKNYDEETISTIYTTKTSPALFDISKVSLSTKTPLTFYGATFIEDIDMSCVASKIDTINLGGSYSNVLGASIKTLNIGIPITKGSDDCTYTGTVSGMTVKMSAVTADGYDALSALLTLNIRGQLGITSSSDLLSDYNRTSVVDVLAMGSGLGNFFSATSGNKFGTLELPGITTNNGVTTAALSTIRLQDSSWDNITFWNTVIGANNASTFTKCGISGDDTLNVPSTLKSVSFLGTTGNYENSKTFVLDWIKCIKTDSENIGDRTLIMDRINWSPTTCTTLLTYDQLADLAKFNAGKNTALDNTLKGYIVLDTGGVKLTAEQLTLIKAWFGDTVFNKNSAGLVIDHLMDYIQINVGSNAYILNELVYLAEGQHASLNATKFALGDSDSSTYNWFLREPGSTETGQIYKKTYLSQGDDGIMYIYADESSYGNYDVEVLCTSNNTSLNTTITIHIVSVTYPTTFSLIQDGTVIRLFGNSYVFWKPSILQEFYLNPSSTYTATVKDVTFNITDLTGTSLLADTTYSQFKNGSTLPIGLDNFIGYTRNSTKQYGIPICSIDTEDAMHQYIINAKVTFQSGKIMTTNVLLILMTDKIAIVSNDASILYLVIHAKYLAQYNQDKSSFYRTDLIAISGTLDFTTTPSWLAITGVKTLNSRSIFKYLPNITEVILDGCTALTSTNVNITYTGDTTDLLVFDLMPNLVKLSILNCTTLNKDIDLTNNINMSILDMSRTTINAILPTGINLSTYELGTPTIINVDTPTRLTPYGIKVDVSTNIGSIDILNIPNNKTYTAFAKIMNL